MYEHGSGIKWKKDVVEIFKLTSSPPPILILIIFLLSLTVNPNSYHPGSDTSVETKPCAAADAVSTLDEQAVQLAYLYADHIKHVDLLFH